MDDRLKILRKHINKQGIDAFLVTNPVNVSYLSGFKPSESYLLISQKQRFFITDFRYEEEAKSTLKDWQLVVLNGFFFKTIADLIASSNLKRIGFEAKSLSFAEYEKFKEHLPNSIFLPTYNIVSSLRIVKTKEEISSIKKAVQLSLKGFDFLKSILRPGICEKDLAIRLEYFLKQQGSEELSFKPIVASGENSSFPHASITERVIQRNDIVLVDIGATYNGYKSDLTRVFFLGRISLKIHKIYNIVFEAHNRAIKAIKPGVRVSKIDKSARDYIKDKGWAGNFRHNLGHGVGLDVHEEPTISLKNKGFLKEGMVFTIEPAIYISGEFGIRIEDMVLVTKQGAEVLSGA